MPESFRGCCSFGAGVILVRCAKLSRYYRVFYKALCFNAISLLMKVDHGRERLFYGLSTLDDRRTIKPGGQRASAEAATLGKPSGTEGIGHVSGGMLDQQGAL